LSVRADSGSFGSALIALLERRVSRFGNILRARVVEFDRKYRQVIEKVAALDGTAHTVIHGDLVPANLLTDSSGTLTAVLDFGFLTTCGDRRLDASIGAPTFNMYGPHAARTTETLTARLMAEAGEGQHVQPGRLKARLLLRES
jgi:aminoglycoside phosphotransferase (APT) family kinase protein